MGLNDIIAFKITQSDRCYGKGDNLDWIKQYIELLSDKNKNKIPDAKCDVRFNGKDGNRFISVVWGTDGNKVNTKWCEQGDKAPECVGE